MTGNGGVGHPDPINFGERVQRSFEPILHPYGLNLSSVDDSRVSYESDRVWLEFSHAAFDGEVALNFGLQGQDRPFSFWLYVGWKSPDHPAAHLDGVASTGEEVQSVLDTIADALRLVGGPLLSGDVATYEAMATVRWWVNHPEMVRHSIERNDS